MKVSQGNMFKVQSRIWMYVFSLYLVGASLIIGNHVNKYIELSSWFLSLGYIFILVGTLISAWLIYEVVKPKKKSFEGKLTKIKYYSSAAKYTTDFYYRYKLTFSLNNKSKNLFIYWKNNEFDNYNILSILLKENELYKVEYYNKSSILTEIENISYSEIETLIQRYLEKHKSKKERNRVFGLLEKYRNR